jgi:hypothetical protein
MLLSLAHCTFRSPLLMTADQNIVLLMKEFAIFRILPDVAHNTLAAHSSVKYSPAL